MEETRIKCIRIAITGPESTGKSTLSQILAQHFKGSSIPEFARTYLEQKPGKYISEDVEIIARKSLEISMEAEKNASPFLFYDTDLLVCKVWSEFVFHQCSDWLKEAVKNQQFEHTFLMNIDLPWQDDPLREHPQQREILFDIYKKELQELNRPFTIISGIEQARADAAILTINQQFPSLF